MRQQVQPLARRHTSVFGYVRHEIGATARRLVVVTVLTVVVSAVLVEAVAIALTWTSPTLPVHLAAGAVALALGYAAAITILLQAMFRGIGRSAEWLTGELEAATQRVLHDGGRQHAPGGPASVASIVAPAVTTPTRPMSTLEHGVMAGIHAN